MKLMKRTEIFSFNVKEFTVVKNHAKLHGVIEIKGCGSGINTVETPVTEKPVHSQW